MLTTRRLGRLAMLVLCSIMFCVGVFRVSLAETKDLRDAPDSIVVGKPVTDMDEGSYNYVYWQARISGSPAVCWIDLEYNTTATSMKATLTIPYSNSWLNIQNGTYNFVGRSFNSDEVYYFWQDGTTSIALSCSGTASINGTQVTSMGVGWDNLK